MAFLDVQPDWHITAPADLDFSTFRVTYRSTRRFTCIRTDPSNDTPIRARQQGMFPSVGDSDPDDLSMICRTSEIKELGLTALECTANYETLPQDIDIGSQQQIIAGWDFEIDSEESEEPIDRARDVFPRDGRKVADITAGRGIAINTVLGESYDPNLTDTASDLAFSFTTTNRPFRADLLWLYRNAVNADTFLNIFPRGTCRMKQCRGTKGFSSDGSIRMSVSCRVVIRDAAPGSTYERAWWKRVRAEGYYVADPLLGYKEKVRALDSYGEPTVRPVLHVAVGAASALGREIAEPDLAEFYEFQPPSLIYRNFNQFFQAIVAT